MFIRTPVWGREGKSSGETLVWAAAPRLRMQRVLLRAQATMEAPMKVTLCAVTVVVFVLLTVPRAATSQPVGKVWRIR
jgi:hypothetical protein